MDKTVSFGTQNVAMEGGVPPNLQQSMATKWDMEILEVHHRKRIRCNWFEASLDRILNRDNSALVKSLHLIKD